jgi:hypothetical protein
MVAVGAVTHDFPVAALVPIVLICAAYVAYLGRDIARSEVNYLPKWAWAVICVVSIPLGGIIYLMVGKRHD